MFGLISKKKLKRYIKYLKERNRGGVLGQNYTKPISDEQRGKNLYLQGYEDGTDNVSNAIISKFML